MAIKHLLFSQDTDQPIKWFDKFDREAIKAAIIEHLTNNPTDCIEHCKEPSKSDLKRFVGYDIINFYQVSPTSKKISLIISKGDKTFYRSIQN